FDYGAARPQPAAPLRLSDHGDGNPVFNAAARVGRLDFDADGRLQAFRDAPQPNQRRATDGLEDGVLHRSQPSFQAPLSRGLPNRGKPACRRLYQATLKSTLHGAKLNPRTWTAHLA